MIDNKYNLFVVSDLHGFYTYLIRDLAKAGFDKYNKSHKLIICGDFFDRGNESFEIYNYIKELINLDRVICIRGNHETFLQSFLEGEDCSFNYFYNGFNKTLDSFLRMNDSYKLFKFDINKEETKFDQYQNWARDKINKDYPDLLNWLKSLPYYYETNNYIFTHASIDGSCSDWHNPEYSAYDFWSPWESLTWDDGSFYEKEINNTDKTIVVGHFNTDSIRSRYNIEPSGKDSILWSLDGKKIFIDSCVVIQHRFNVLKIETYLN